MVAAMVYSSTFVLTGLFSLSKLLKIRTQVSEVVVRQLVFANDGVLTAQSEADLQRLIVGP